ALIRKSAAVAVKARDDFEKKTGVHNYVAGSVGPYGAYLADGSEYRGDYGLSHEEYVAFHAPRIEELAAGGVDCLAIETQPKLSEVRAILDYLQEKHPALPVYVSFSLRDPATISEGLPLAEAVQEAGRYPQVFAAGANC
ncbi:homocysteine S-methyltransferase family protein, partial [Lactobacillus nasalidis]|uniref:homocysteine S-methyltransferase family protein n=1 Tax=Lactobacillus nasalidis TaxID=2797258 RepID=UPI0019169DC4